jgi:LAO/AO transport system kinase
MTELALAVRSGDRRALARAISLVESQSEDAHRLLADLWQYTAASLVVGLTGAPGVGKSTLVDGLARAYAKAGRRVGVLAIDPSSPFSGGALLGDRIRMDDPDPRVFIRSLATRGHLGGVNRALGGAIALMAAAGHDLVLVETVGAGQSEVEIMSHADLTVVVLMPGLGDDIQANKAGILEIGDLFVVNKADLPGADLTVREIRSMLSLVDKERALVPITKTIATQGEGIDALLAAIDAFGRNPEERMLQHSRRLQQADRRLGEALAELVVAKIKSSAGPGHWEAAVEQIAARRLDPEGAARELLRPTIEEA